MKSSRHFDVSTPLTGVMYSLMGIGATLLVSVCLWLAMDIARHGRGLADPFTFSVIIGLLLTFGLGDGFGGHLDSSMSHRVGATPTDAGGLPGFGWARDGGDPRVAHVFGMHAMEVIPALGLMRRDRAGARLLIAPRSSATGA
jgi:hypothetical protein